MGRRAEFLKGGKVLHLATCGPDGMPHVVPVWYIYRDRTIHVGTNTRTAKAKNVARTGRAAFCVDRGVRSPIYGVMGRGRARLITEPAKVEGMARTILLRYFDSMDDPSAQELLADTDCIISLEPGPLSDWS